MHSRPCQPRPETTEVYFSGLQYREALAHDGHASFVKVAKRAWCGFAGNAVVNYFSGVAPLLHRYLSNTGEWLSAFLE